MSRDLHRDGVNQGRTHAMESVERAGFGEAALRHSTRSSAMASGASRPAVRRSHT